MCGWNDYGLKTGTCNSTGETYTLQCAGRAEQAVFTCQTAQGMTCAIWDGSSWDSSTCTETSESSTSVTCSCTGLVSFASTSTTGSYTSLSLDIVSVSATTTSSFLAGSRKSSLLAPYNTFKSIVVFVCIGE